MQVAEPVLSCCAFQAPSWGMHVEPVQSRATQLPEPHGHVFLGDRVHERTGKSITMGEQERGSLLNREIR